MRCSGFDGIRRHRRGLRVRRVRGQVRFAGRGLLRRSGEGRGLPASRRNLRGRVLGRLLRRGCLRLRWRWGVDSFSHGRRLDFRLRSCRRFRCGNGHGLRCWRRQNDQRRAVLGTGCSRRRLRSGRRRHVRAWRLSERELACLPGNAFTRRRRGRQDDAKRRGFGPALFPGQHEAGQTLAVPVEAQTQQQQVQQDRDQQRKAELVALASHGPKDLACAARCPVSRLGSLRGPASAPV